jgi:hypothetical protein
MADEPQTSLAESKGVTNPLVLVQAAIDKGCDPDKLGKLMDLAERWQANQAAAAFGDAIASFQAECPTVFKRRATQQTDRFEGYNYASYDDVMREAGPLLAKNNIAVTFSMENVPQVGITVTCKVRVGIHAEDTTLTIPIPAMKVNDTQKFGAAMSYAKRYALCAALNIVVTDEDNDAAGMDTVSKDQIDQMSKIIKDKGVNFKRFCEWAGEAAKRPVTNLEEMPVAIFAKAMDMLNRKKAPATKGDAYEGA